jgi:hypothetical protein
MSFKVSGLPAALGAAAILCLVSGAAAEPATETVARSIEAAVRLYGPDSWASSSLLKVSPDGEGYRLAFETSAALAPAIMPWTVKTATPLSFGLRPAEGGLWNFETSGPFALGTELLAGNRSNALSLDVASQTVAGLFDPVAVFPRRADVGLKDAKLALRAGQESVKFSIGALDMTSSVTDQAAGKGNVDATFSIDGLSATTGAFPRPEAKVSAERVDGTYAIGRLDLAGIGNIVRFWQVTAGGKDAAALTDAERAELRTILKAHLPMLEAIGGAFTAKNVRMSEAGRGFSAETLGYSSRWEGMGDKASFIIGASLTKVTIDAGIWPRELEAALPTSAGLDVGFGGFDLGALWRDAALVRSEKETALLPRDHATTLLFPDGRIGVTIKDLTLQSPLYDFRLTGQMSLAMAQTSLPTGSVTVTALDFDRTVKYLQDNAKTVPLYSRAAFVALMMKGLGKDAGGGTTTWAVTFDAAGKIVVNGQPLPI